MRTVHKTCPPEGCDICQSDWPCARLAASKQEESCLSQLAAANERIRELGAKLDRYTRISESGLSLGDHLDCIVDLTVEREVSDKLVAALQRIAKLRIVEVDGILDDYIDVIAAAIRKGQA